MPLSRLLLPLCGLLLALAVTTASATAPLYGPGEVAVWSDYRASVEKYKEQVKHCSASGGSLVPMVTEAVYTLVADTLNQDVYIVTFSFMGASSLLSSSWCGTSYDSLSCIWYWDQGRYAGAENAVAFYRGNRDSSVLTGAGMIGTTVENHWRFYSDTERCPCGYRQRYGAVIIDYDRVPYWTDTDTKNKYHYDSNLRRTKYSLCASEMATTTTMTTTTTTPMSTTTTKPMTTTTTPMTTMTTSPTTAPPTTETTTVGPTTTTTAQPPEPGSSGMDRPLVVGLCLASAGVVVGLVVLLSLTPL